MAWGLCKSFKLEGLVRLYGVRMSDGTLCFLVKVVDTAKEEPGVCVIMESGFREFVKTNGLLASWAPLGCCWEQAHFNGRDWLDTLGSGTNLSSFGDCQVVCSFREDVTPYLTYKTSHVVV